MGENKREKKKKGMEEMEEGRGCIFLVVRDRNKTRRSPSIFRARNRHLKHIQTTIKMFAVQQTFATKTVQVNKVNKTTKASFVQDMKKVNTMSFCFLRLILSRQLPRQFFRTRGQYRSCNGKPKRPYLRVTRELHFS